ncbi:hypothetical protein [Rhodococcus xishaensis]|uniref:Excreted virulence factor EspC, type VII ESX diderm n=1 Tax=Rhodococcus xishaensis TaxID=2487364 RepID=A0A438AQH6_9NOCA|nr:hypothetical protein [Rhodococcus xishaensis]RVW01196.1 hypothetical protein EGT50_13165 [Rhodococcus xishaensis]
MGDEMWVDPQQLAGAASGFDLLAERVGNTLSTLESALDDAVGRRIGEFGMVAGVLSARVGESIKSELSVPPDPDKRSGSAGLLNMT